MSSPNDTPFTKTNSKSIYGKTPLESWVGTVVSFGSQKDQVEGGWGWRYKVRIMGDNTNTDQISDEQLSYAYVLLPTTAGSGGAFKMRSVRISQGDFVYGVRGGGAGAPTMILVVFPRTATQGSGDDPSNRRRRLEAALKAIQDSGNAMMIESLKAAIDGREANLNFPQIVVIVVNYYSLLYFVDYSSKCFN